MVAYVHHYLVTLFHFQNSNLVQTKFPDLLIAQFTSLLPQRDVVNSLSIQNNVDYKGFAVPRHCYRVGTEIQCVDNGYNSIDQDVYTNYNSYLLERDKNHRKMSVK